MTGRKFIFENVIKRILQSRGEWDPPWRRERRARGPPRQREFLTHEDHEFSQVAPESEEEFSQLPPDGEGT